jgi:hypothetical protein
MGSPPILGSPPGDGASGDIGAVLVGAHACPVGSDQSINTKVGAIVRIDLLTRGSVGANPYSLTGLKIGCLREERHQCGGLN